MAGFDSSDIQVLQALATHISVSLQNMHEEGEASLRDTINILKEHGVSGLDEHQTAGYRKRRPLFPE